jgi:hypothetical protein
MLDLSKIKVGSILQNFFLKREIVLVLNIITRNQFGHMTCCVYDLQLCKVISHRTFSTERWVLLG